MRRLRICVENSTWNNIGDAFYQLSMRSLLKNCLNAEIVDFDGPAKRAFRPARFVKKNTCDIRSQTDGDHFVLSGPILSLDFLETYGHFIRKILERGKSYSLLSVHAYAEGGEIEVLREFFKSFPPIAFHTRDRDTFEKFRGISALEYDGICFAFFVNKLDCIPTYLREYPYICSSFHNGIEPKVSYDSIEELLARPVENARRLGPLTWRVARHFEFLRRNASTVGGAEIIRPVHGFYPLTYLIFSRPNSYISHNPLVFLGIYKSCKATITDRVHAGVASLSFGNPAFIARLDGRYSLFRDAPITERNGWFFPKEDELDLRYNEIERWLSGPFWDALTAIHGDRAV
jgi:hypothetical protein